MVYWNEYSGHHACVVGTRKLVDNTIYSFDIETTSYVLLNGKQYAGIEYENFTKEEQDETVFCSTMYIWMFSINDTVYYGRTWEEFKEFLKRLCSNTSGLKIVFVHNLAFEFEYLSGEFEFETVLARTSRKVMKAILKEYNIEFRCSLMMTNMALKELPKMYNLPVEKKVGDLDYTKVRHSGTPLTQEELGYCENDCLVIYYYIIEELKEYERVDKIPLTSTGHVRRELKAKIADDYKYKSTVKKAINVDPHIYNLLIESFAGGYTHANWIHADEIIENVDSWDFTSSYPYVLVTHKFPSTEFKECHIKSAKQLVSNFAYLLVVRFTNISSKYYNNFISQSKCRNIKNGKYDNGRVLSADELEIVLTDVDFKFILESHYIEHYEILESYFSVYKYLPKQFIEFVLDKYVNKTAYKNVFGKEVEYNKEKQKFNALYGMSVTNMIKDTVEYDNTLGWIETPLTNTEIEEALLDEKKKGFLSFAYGVWVTAYARNNLLKNLIKLDEYAIYCDTDSIKVAEGYDKNVILEYNNFVERKIKRVSEVLDIDIDRFAPKDVFGEKHMLGLFDDDGHYEKFITQGAKKYAYYKKVKKSKIKDTSKVIKKLDEDTYLVLEITVAGVPKAGAKALDKIEDFKDDFVFKSKYTNKNLLIYNEEIEPFNLVDYLGNERLVTDKTGCCLVPTTYTLGKSLEYATLISEDSSKRAIYKEN